MSETYDPVREDEAKRHIDYSEQKIQDYLKNGEISSQLSLDATLAVLHSENDWDRTFWPYAVHERKWIHVYRQVAAAVNEIQLKMKEFEFKHWMGFHDDDVKELLVLYERRERSNWRTFSEDERTFMRELWDPFDYEHACTKKERPLWKKHWLKYHKRRVRKPLQSLNGEFCSSETEVLERLSLAGEDARAAMEHMKIMMGGSAGRVLLTIQDRYPQGDDRSIYGGAWISLIFDETSQWPRGGVQGHCATKDEALSMIQACIDYMPALFPDKTIGIGF